MSKVIAVGIGGFIGAVVRYLISSWTAGLVSRFPLGTLIVNILGGFIMGILMGFIEFKASGMSGELRLFLTAGLMGGLTTFSSFSFETVFLFQTGDYKMALANIVLNVVLSLSACYGGYALLRLS